MRIRLTFVSSPDLNSGFCRHLNFGTSELARSVGTRQGIPLDLIRVNTVSWRWGVKQCTTSPAPFWLLWHFSLTFE
jgi:hypothetical protein